MAASLSWSVVILLVWRMRSTSLADSWTVESKLRIHCWMAGVSHASGTSFKEGRGGCRTSARGLVGFGIRRGGWSAEGRSGAEERPASLRGVRSIPWAWSFSRGLARSLEVALRARRAEPSAAAGAWAWSCSVRRAIKGAWKARAWVVLLGTVVPCAEWRASAIASKSKRLSRISCKR